MLSCVLQGAGALGDALVNAAGKLLNSTDGKGDELLNQAVQVSSATRLDVWPAT